MANKFKVGDRVRVIEKHNFEIGDEFIIISFSESGEIAWFEGENNGEYVRRLELVPPIKLKSRKKLNIKITDVNQIVGQDVIKQQLRVAIESDMPVLIVGDTGTGKTSVIRELAQERNQRLVRFSLTGETTVDDILGTKTLTNGSVEYIYGQFVNAVKSGDWVVFDELNVALPEILFALQSLLDDDKFLTLPQNGGEVIRAHKKFRFFATMNPVDEYAGTKDLNKAFKSRFNMVINMDYPDPDVETEIVRQKCKLDDKTARVITDFGQLARTAKKNDEIFYTCSTRDLIHWGNLSAHLPLDQAFELSILNKANGDTERLSELYKTLNSEYELLENEGYELSIDHFKKLAKQIKDDRKKLANDQQEWQAQIDKTTERIRQEVISKLVSQVE